MYKEFIWTDDLVKKFILKECNNIFDEAGLNAYINDFKTTQQQIMNHYKLKKDLPHCDAGERFTYCENVDCFIQSRHFQRVSGLDKKQTINEYRFSKDHIKDTEWFEEIKPERFVFESREELENHIAAWNMEHDTEVSNHGYNGAIKQAIEVINCFPIKSKGTNEGKETIYKALQDKLGKFKISIDYNNL
jgi:hypothetical protein